MGRYSDPIPALKRQLADELVRLTRDWTATQLLFAIHIDQPRLSDLRRGKLERFSLESLIKYVHRFGYRADIAVTRQPPGWLKPKPGSVQR